MPLVCNFDVVSNPANYVVPDNAVEEADVNSIVEKIFFYTQMSPMAHTIRGVEKLFRKYGIHLCLFISAHPERRSGPRCSLRLRKGTLQVARTASSGTIDTEQFVEAEILMNQNAPHTLLRIGVAHEIAHLLLELKHYQESKKNQANQKNLGWRNGDSFTCRLNSEEEKWCTKFAYELCKLHQLYVSDEKIRKEMINFPENFFNRHSHVHLESPQDTNYPPSMVIGPNNPAYIYSYPYRLNTSKCFDKITEEEYNKLQSPLN